MTNPDESNRLKLHELLKTILGSSNVYFNPPESVMMNYPAIRYFRARPDVLHANNDNYILTHCYEVIVISRSPIDDTVGKVMSLPMCSWDRHYVAEDLHHDVFTLYF